MEPLVVLSVIGLGILVLLGASVFIFWFWMLVDCCRRRFTRGAERLIWLIILLFTNLLGTVVYYLLIKRFNPEGLLDEHGHLR